MTYQNAPSVLTPRGVSTDGDVSILQPLKDHDAMRETSMVSKDSSNDYFLYLHKLMSALLGAMTIFSLSLSLSLSLSDVYKT